MNAGERGLSTLDRIVLIGASVMFLACYRLWKWSRNVP